MEYFGRIKSKICGLCDNNKILQRVLFMEWKKQMNNKQTHKFWLHWIHRQIDKKKRYIYSIENAIFVSDYYEV